MIQQHAKSHKNQAKWSEKWLYGKEDIHILVLGAYALPKSRNLLMFLCIM
jgi:hypothetical protein